MRRKILLGCVLPLLVVGALGWWGWRALTRADPKPARYETVGRGDVEIKVTETGQIEPLKKVEIKSKVAGRVARLYVREGDHVRAGQLLAEIDPTEINSQVAQMRAQLEGARAREIQAVRGVTYQQAQTVSGIGSAEEALHSAEARLAEARQEYRTQPALSASAIAQAAAGLKAARDNLAVLQQSTQPQALVQAQSGYEEASAAADNARRQLQRQERLLERGFVSQLQVDTARTDVAAANARLQQAKKRLDLVDEQNRLEVAAAESRAAQEEAALATARSGEAQVDIRRQQVLSAEAAVRQARAQLLAARAGDQQDRMRRDDVAQARAAVTQIENQLREIEVRQGDTRLVSTTAGVVTYRYIEQGELVTSGVSTFSSGTPVLQVADLSRMLVNISVNEVDVQKVRVGLPVEITVDGVKGVSYRGRVTKVAPAAVNAAQPGASGGGGSGGVIRFAVEITVDRPDARLRPGMSARCSIIVARRRSVLRLPIDGIEGGGATARVQVVTLRTKDGKPADIFTPRTVTVGLRGDNFVEIVSGVREGERVKPVPYTGPKRQDIDLGPPH